MTGGVVKYRYVGLGLTRLQGAAVAKARFGRKPSWLDRDDEQPQTHAFFRVGSPTNWPASSKWEEGFDLTEADDRYAGINPYASPLARPTLGSDGQRPVLHVSRLYPTSGISTG